MDEHKSTTVSGRNEQPVDAPIERMMPETSSTGLLSEHLGRYRFAAGFAPGKRVLDAACGNGYGSQILVDAGASSYVGVDIEESAIRSAVHSHGGLPRVRFQVDDVEQLASIGDATIDILVSFETIEHLDNPSRFLRAANRVLRSDGLLVVSTPNRAVSNPWGTLESRPPNPFHVREWRPREFRQLLEKFFRVECEMGQGAEFPLRTFGRALSSHRSFAWMKAAYQAMKRSPQPSARGILPVAATPRGRVPRFMVCVCSKDRT